MILKRGNEQKETGFVTNRSCSRGLSLKSQNATNWVRKIEVNRTRRRVPTLMVTDVGNVYSLVDPAHKIASCPVPAETTVGSNNSCWSSSFDTFWPD